MTTSAQLESELRRLTERDKELREHLDQLVVAMTPRIGTAAAQWVRDRAKKSAVESPEVVQAMEDNDLSRLKTRVSNFAEQVPAIVAKSISDRDLWPHRAPTKPGEQRREFSAHSYFANAFRDSIGGLGSILNDAQLIKRHRGTGMAEWETDRAGGFRYGYSPGFDPRELPEWKEYLRLFEELSQVELSASMKKRELESARTRERWDSV